MRSTFFSPLSAGGSSLWRPCPSAASILLDASIFSACASGPFLRCFKASLSQFSGNSFFLLLLVSFRWDLKFHYLGPFSHSFLLASSEPPPLLCLCIWHDLGSTLSPSPARLDWLRCWCRRAGSSAFSATGLGQRSGIVLTREEEHVRFEFWKEIDVFPLPPRPAPPRPALPLAGTNSWIRVHALTSYQEFPGGAWGLAAPALLVELGTHPQLSATCNPSCLLSSWAQSTGARAHPLL